MNDDPWLNADAARRFEDEDRTLFARIEFGIESSGGQGTLLSPVTPRELRD